MQRIASCATLLAFVALAPSVSATPKDPAARGLGLFVHAPKEVPSGATLPVQIRVFGFPTVSTLAPLAKATVEAAWDPESLGEQVASVPKPVEIVCEEGGRGHLDLAVPPGRGKIKLLVSARWQGHERTRTLEIECSPRYELDLRVSDTDVVHGGKLSAWVVLHDRVTGRPAGGRPVDLALKEGAVARFSRRLVTDQAGMASTEVAIPFVEDPEWKWILSARTAMGHGDEAEATITLGVREETPQAPLMRAHWLEKAAPPGSKATFVVEVRDGTGRGIERLSLRYWVGPRGTQAPKDDNAWLSASTEVRTDADGRAMATVETPKIISPRGSHLTLVAKALVEGHPLVGQDILALATPAPELELEPELGVLLPGQPQRLFLHASLDDKPIAAEFVLTGHGLDARVRTNARGWGAVVWNLPPEIGALVPDKANTGCAGEVAATVHARWIASGGTAAPGIDRCLRVDRDAVAAVRPGRPMVKAGESLPVRILGGKGSASVMLQGPGERVWQSTWLGDATRGGTVTLPPSAKGEWTLGAAGMATPKDKHVLGGRVLVLPRVLPRLSVTPEKPEGIAPGGSVVIRAVLDDGHGQPLLGSVGAVVFDKAGGAHPERLLALDTRRSLAAAAGIADQDVDAFLEGDSAFDIERWAAVAKGARSDPPPAFDPPATVDEDIDKAFREIVQSLEGAVYEASSDPERLRDARVHTAAGFALNPELLTLVTEAMDEPPLTPGGEPWRLADLMAIDGQVKFDNVARRVTRLKLFKLLSSIRTFLFENRMGPDEPALHDPNALVRRLVRDEVVQSGDLLDPWGHGMSFVRSAAPRIPFLSMVPGYRLLSAGPDGRFGTADDVQDPFQRVLASKTPYAKAVEEDRLVDAKWDMRVGDETVEAWKSLLQELTGHRLGDQIDDAYGSGGLGTVGSGYGGGGAGLGGRSSRGLDPGAAHWLPPVRTDERGRARLTVPLGDAETTWQIVLVAMTDEGWPAVSSADVTTSLPLSVRVATGAAWMVGDVVNVQARVRNRTDKAVTARLRLAATGAVRILDASASQREIPVPAQSMVTVTAQMRGMSVGTAMLEATVEGGELVDRLKHEWAVRPAGKTVLAENARWLDRSATVPLPAPTQDMPAQGSGRLVLERGISPVLAAALDSFQPEHLTGERAFADALEVFGRVRSWAVMHGGESNALAVRARELARQVPEHEKTQRKQRPEQSWEQPLRARARFWQVVANPPGNPMDGIPAERPDSEQAHHKCPPAKVPPIPEALDWLAIAPRSARGTEDACWAALRTSLLNQLSSEKDPLMLARAVLSFLDSPSQTAVATALADRLAALVPVRNDGAVILPSGLAGDRATRAIVVAALVRSARLPGGDKRATAAVLWPRLLVERDDKGGYGSAEATRQVVRALLEIGGTATSPAVIRCTELSAAGKPLSQRELTLAADSAVTLQLSPAASSTRIETSSPGLLVRAQRPLFRSYFLPADEAASPLHLDLAMPKPASKEGLASLQVNLRHDLGRPTTIMVRIPLPPGATLAEKVADMWQVQGAIYVRTSIASDSLPRVIPVPLRFTLSGTFTMPEATARITDDEFSAARAPARPLTVGDR